MKKILLTGLAILLLCGLTESATSPIGYNTALTLAELRQEVKNNFLVMTDALFPDSVLDDFINAGCRAVAAKGVIQHVDTIIWVANTKYYDLDSAFLGFIAIYPETVVGERALDYIRAKDVGKIAASTELSSPEYVWITERDILEDVPKIWFYPPPTCSSNLTLIYTAYPVQLTATTDTTDIPTEFIDDVVRYATARCFAKAQKYQEAAWWFSLFDQFLEKQLAENRAKGYDYIVVPKTIE